ncbi:MAG: hypothetical protein H6825_04975 [Planctomycetes bacterium]|nr:hypothetical protein [Planctomycetota bacterium]
MSIRIGTKRQGARRRTSRSELRPSRALACSVPVTITSSGVLCPSAGRARRGLLPVGALDHLEAALLEREGQLIWRMDVELSTMSVVRLISHPRRVAGRALLVLRVQVRAESGEGPGASLPRAGSAQGEREGGPASRTLRARASTLDG